MAHGPDMHLGKLIDGLLRIRIGIGLWLTITGVSDIVVAVKRMFRYPDRQHHKWIRIVAHIVGGVNWLLSWKDVRVIV
jgi:hypothetical protein